MIRSLLIVQPGFLGDAVLATGIVRALHSIFPSTEIGFLVRAEFAELFQGHQAITRVHSFRKGEKGELGRIVEEVRGAKYEGAVVPHRSLRSGLIPFRAGIPSRIGFRQSDFSLLFTNRVEYNIALREIDRNASLLTPLGFTTLSERRHGWLIPNPQAIERLKPLRSPMGRTIAVAPGSVWETKRWPATKFAELVQVLSDAGAKVLLVGSRGEDELCALVARGANLPIENVLAGKLSLTEFTALCSILDALVVNDSAPLHIAESVGTPVVALFGPTVPEFGFAPYLSASHVVERLGLSCRPCGIHGHRACPIGTHECMESISPQQVLNVLDSIPNSSTIQ